MKWLTKLTVNDFILGHRGGMTGNNNGVMSSMPASMSSEMLSDNSCDSLSSAASGSDDFPASPDSWLGENETTNSGV